MEMEAKASSQEKRHHVVIVPTPGMGHLIPLAEFAKRLVVHHNFAVTFIVPNDGTSMELQTNFLQSLPANFISSIFLPKVSFDDLPEDSMVETRIALSLIRSLPALRDSLKTLTQSTRLALIVIDLFGPAAFDLARELGIPIYILFPSTAMALSFVFHLPKLDETYSCEYRDLPEPVQLPGCFPVHGLDFISPVQDRNNVGYKAVLELAKRYCEADGFLVNSFVDLEPGAFKALNERTHHNNPPVYPVGPLVQTGSPPSLELDGSECLNWLDKQPEGSVLFVSFGSGGTLSQDQLNELSFGLEMSGQRFLWVVRSPHEKAANAAYFGIKSKEDPFDFLPRGFLERTKEVGLVVPSWAPQVRVLSHGSTGGFLSHCGWNSTLESIVNGVPMIAWPLYAEQKMNAVLLGDDVKVAFRVKFDENGLVGREEIAKCVRDLMKGEEGKLIRKRVEELKEAASLVLSEEGSSAKALAEVAQMWKSQI
ncbi:hypothetical protein UlMin_042479 [Ulmus minor]